MGETDQKAFVETKIVVLGASGVGKTSMLKQYIDGEFNEFARTATIGAAFVKKVLEIDPYVLSLQIWDTAGQERFRALASLYYRGAHAAVLVFDMNELKTLKALNSWVEELNVNIEDEGDMIFVLAGNKADLIKKDDEISEEITKYAEEIGAKFIQTSAKTGKGLREIFEYVGTEIVRLKVAELKEDDDIFKKESSGGCCS